jgi:hypothetical protein
MLETKKASSLSNSLHPDPDVANRLPSLVVVHGDHTGTLQWRSFMDEKTIAWGDGRSRQLTAFGAADLR